MIGELSANDAAEMLPSGKPWGDHVLGDGDRAGGAEVPVVQNTVRETGTNPCFNFHFWVGGPLDTRIQIVDGRTLSVRGFASSVGNPDHAAFDEIFLQCHACFRAE